jgi:predicted RNase H-like nuclease (RuvC/YqgF family)
VSRVWETVYAVTVQSRVLQAMHSLMQEEGRKAMSQTPRTDAVLSQPFKNAEQKADALKDHSRELERDLAELTAVAQWAKRELERLGVDANSKSIGRHKEWEKFKRVLAKQKESDIELERENERLRELLEQLIETQMCSVLKSGERCCRAHCPTCDGRILLSEKLPSIKDEGE